MSAIAFPQRHLGALRELATRLLDSRKPGTATDSLARQLLVGFVDACAWHGLDGVMTAIAAAHEGVDAADPSTLADDPEALRALSTRLAALELDGGGPRNARPGRIADALLDALGLATADDGATDQELDDAVRAAALAAMRPAVEERLAAPALREAILADARTRIAEEHAATFDKIAAQLDERGLTLVKQPKVPLHASQAVQVALTQARAAVLGAIASDAVARAGAVIAQTLPEAAARLDEPVTLRVTPREVAARRAGDARTSKVPAAFAEATLLAASSLARIAWRAPERLVRPYGAKEVFAVGELLAHPKFGQGEVAAVNGARIDVEFGDEHGRKTLAHGGAPR